MHRWWVGAGCGVKGTDPKSTVCRKEKLMPLVTVYPEGQPGSVGENLQWLLGSNVDYGSNK